MIVLWMPACITDRLSNGNDKNCVWLPSKNKQFVIVIAVIGHHGSCFVIIMCYTCILLLLRKLAKIKFGVNFIIDPNRTASNSVTGWKPENNDNQAYNGDIFFVGKNSMNAKSEWHANADSSGRKENVLNENNSRWISQKSSAETGQHIQPKVINGRERQAFVTLSYIVISYMVLWVPFHVVFDISAINPSLVPDKIYRLTFLMTYINSTVNPILYGFSSNDFRQAFKDMFKKFFS